MVTILTTMFATSFTMMPVVSVAVNLLLPVTHLSSSRSVDASAAVKLCSGGLGCSLSLSLSWSGAASFSSSCRKGTLFSSVCSTIKTEHVARA